MALLPIDEHLSATCPVRPVEPNDVIISLELKLPGLVFHERRLPNPEVNETCRGSRYNSGPTELTAGSGRPVSGFLVVKTALLNAVLCQLERHFAHPRHRVGRCGTTCIAATGMPSWLVTVGPPLGSSPHVRITDRPF